MQHGEDAAEQNSISGGVTSRPTILTSVLHSVPSTVPEKSGQRMNTTWTPESLAGCDSDTSFD